MRDTSSQSERSVHAPHCERVDHRKVNSTLIHSTWGEEWWTTGPFKLLKQKHVSNSLSEIFPVLQRRAVYLKWDSNKDVIPGIMCSARETVSWFHKGTAEADEQR